jgi:hypothetical protein
MWTDPFHKKHLIAVLIALTIRNLYPRKYVQKHNYVLFIKLTKDLKYA